MTINPKQPSSAMESDVESLSVLETIFNSFSAELSAETGYEEKAPMLAALLAREKPPSEVEIRALIEAKS